MLKLTGNLVSPVSSAVSSYPIESLTHCTSVSCKLFTSSISNMRTITSYFSCKRPLEGSNSNLDHPAPELKKKNHSNDLLWLEWCYVVKTPKPILDPPVHHRLSKLPSWGPSSTSDLQRVVRNNKRIWTQREAKPEANSNTWTTVNMVNKATWSNSWDLLDKMWTPSQCPTWNRNRCVQSVPSPKGKQLFEESPQHRIRYRRQREVYPSFSDEKRPFSS